MRGKGWAEVFPVHKMCLLSKVLLEVAPGLASARRAPVGMRVGYDHIELGRWLLPAARAKPLTQLLAASVLQGVTLGLGR